MKSRTKQTNKRETPAGGEGLTSREVKTDRPSQQIYKMKAINYRMPYKEPPKWKKNSLYQASKHDLPYREPPKWKKNPLYKEAVAVKPKRQNKGHLQDVVTPKNKNPSRGVSTIGKFSQKSKEKETQMNNNLYCDIDFAKQVVPKEEQECKRSGRAKPGVGAFVFPGAYGLLEMCGAILQICCALLALVFIFFAVKKASATIWANHGDTVVRVVWLLFTNLGLLNLLCSMATYEVGVSVIKAQAVAGSRRVLYKPRKHTRWRWAHILMTCMVFLPFIGCVDALAQGTKFSYFCGVNNEQNWSDQCAMAVWSVFQKSGTMRDRFYSLPLFTVRFPLLFKVKIWPLLTHFWKSRKRKLYKMLARIPGLCYLAAPNACYLGFYPTVRTLLKGGVALNVAQIELRGSKHLHYVPRRPVRAPLPGEWYDFKVGDASNVRRDKLKVVKPQEVERPDNFWYRVLVHERDDGKPMPTLEHVLSVVRKALFVIFVVVVIHIWYYHTQTGIGYCYSDSGLVFTPLFHGQWPRAASLLGFLREGNYTVTSVPGVFHVVKGGDTNATQIEAMFRNHPYWMVGGSSLLGHPIFDGRNDLETLLSHVPDSKRWVFEAVRWLRPQHVTFFLAFLGICRIIYNWSDTSWTLVVIGLVTSSFQRDIHKPTILFRPFGSRGDFAPLWEYFAMMSQYYDAVWSPIASVAEGTASLHAVEDGHALRCCDLLANYWPSLQQNLALTETQHVERMEVSFLQRVCPRYFSVPRMYDSLRHDLGVGATLPHGLHYAPLGGLNIRHVIPYDLAPPAWCRRAWVILANTTPLGWFVNTLQNVWSLSTPALYIGNVKGSNGTPRVMPPQRTCDGLRSKVLVTLGSSNMVPPTPNEVIKIVAKRLDRKVCLNDIYYQANLLDSNGQLRLVEKVYTGGRSRSGQMNRKVKGGPLCAGETGTAHFEVFPRYGVIISHGGAGTETTARWAGCEHINLSKILDRQTYGNATYEFTDEYYRFLFPLVERLTLMGFYEFLLKTPWEWYTPCIRHYLYTHYVHVSLVTFLLDLTFNTASGRAWLVNTFMADWIHIVRTFAGFSGFIALYLYVNNPDFFGPVVLVSSYELGRVIQKMCTPYGMAKVYMWGFVPQLCIEIFHKIRLFVFRRNFKYPLRGLAFLGSLAEVDKNYVRLRFTTTSFWEIFTLAWHAELISEYVDARGTKKAWTIGLLRGSKGHTRLQVTDSVANNSNFRTTLELTTPVPAEDWETLIPFLSYRLGNLYAPTNDCHTLAIGGLCAWYYENFKTLPIVVRLTTFLMLAFVVLLSLTAHFLLAVALAVVWVLLIIANRTGYEGVGFLMKFWTLYYAFNEERRGKITGDPRLLALMVRLGILNVYLLDGVLNYTTMNILPDGAIWSEVPQVDMTPVQPAGANNDSDTNDVLVATNPSADASSVPETQIGHHSARPPLVDVILGPKQSILPAPKEAPLGEETIVAHVEVPLLQNTKEADDDPHIAVEMPTLPVPASQKPLHKEKNFLLMCEATVPQAVLDLYDGATTDLQIAHTVVLTKDPVLALRILQSCPSESTRWVDANGKFIARNGMFPKKRVVIIDDSTPDDCVIPDGVRVWQGGVETLTSAETTVGFLAKNHNWTVVPQLSLCGDDIVVNGTPMPSFRFLKFLGRGPDATVKAFKRRMFFSGNAFRHRMSQLEQWAYEASDIKVLSSLVGVFCSPQQRRKVGWLPLTEAYRIKYPGVSIRPHDDPAFEEMTMEETLELQTRLINRLKRQNAKKFLPPLKVSRRVGRESKGMKIDVHDELKGEGLDGQAFSSRQTMAASLASYCESPTNYPMPVHRRDAIARCICDNAPEKHYNARLMDPHYLARAMLKKKGYSCGLDFLTLGLKQRRDIRSGGYYNALIDAGTTPLRTGVYSPSLFHAFPKSQIVDRAKLVKNPAKLRSITASTLQQNIAQLIFTGDVNSRHDFRGMGKVGMPTNGTCLGVEFENISEYPYLYSLDATAFDRNCSERAFCVVQRIREMGFENHPEFETIRKHIACLIKQTQVGYIINLIAEDNETVRKLLKGKELAAWQEVEQTTWEDIEAVAEAVLQHSERFDGGFLKKFRGGCTGDANVTANNSWCTQIMLIDGICHVLSLPPAEFNKNFYLANLSDDNMIGGRMKIPLKELFAYLQKVYGVEWRLEAKPGSILDQTFLAKHPIAGVDFADEFREFGIDIPKFAVQHDRQRLLRSISDCNIAANRHYSGGKNKQLNYELDRIVGQMANTCHHRDIHERLFKLATEKLMQLPRHRRGKRHIPEYGEIFRAWYSTKRLEDFNETHILQLHMGRAYDCEMSMLRMIKNIRTITRKVPFSELGCIPDVVAPTSDDSFDFIERFIWSSYICKYGVVPSIPVFTNLCRNSALGNLTNPGAWAECIGAYLGTDKNLMVRLRTVSTWEMLLFTSIYKGINSNLEILNSLPLGNVALRLLQLFRTDLPQFYSACSYVHFLGTGESPQNIGLLMPKDRNYYIKRIAALLTVCVKMPTEFGVLPIDCLIRPLALGLDGAAGLASFSVVEDIKMEDRCMSTPWRSAAVKTGELLKTFNAVTITAPTGTGKTRYLPTEIMLLGKRVDVILPRNLLCREFVKSNPSCHWAKRGAPRKGKFNVMTYGYLAHVFDTEPNREGVYIFDEAHERNPEWVWLVKYALKSAKAVLLTATPLSWMKCYPHIRVKAPPLFPVNEEKPLTNSVLSEFMVRVKTCNRILIIEPTISMGSYYIDQLRQHYNISAVTGDSLSVPKSGHIVATAVADASLTIPGCDCVIDSGESLVNQTGTLQRVTYDKATYIQRRGRTGRTCPGTYITFKQHYKGEYPVCPSIQQLLSESHICEAFDDHVNLQKNDSPALRVFGDSYAFLSEPVPIRTRVQISYFHQAVLANSNKPMTALLKIFDNPDALHHLRETCGVKSDPLALDCEAAYIAHTPHYYCNEDLKRSRPIYEVRHHDGIVDENF